MALLTGVRAFLHTYTVASCSALGQSNRLLLKQLDRTAMHWLTQPDLLGALQMPQKHCTCLSMSSFRQIHAWTDTVSGCHGVYLLVYGCIEVVIHVQIHKLTAVVLGHHDILTIVLQGDCQGLPNAWHSSSEVLAEHILHCFRTCSMPIGC